MTKETARTLRTAMWYMFILAVLAMICFSSPGCVGSDGTSMRWAPTEAQKQASDLVVQNVQALKPHVPVVAETIRADAERAARATQAYVGLPETPLDPTPPSEVPVTDPAREQALGDAEQASARPQPTIEDVGYDLADLLLGSLGGVAGIGGLAAAGRKILRNRKKRQQKDEDFIAMERHCEIRASGWEKARLEAEAQRSAVDELVDQIEEIKTWAANAHPEDWAGQNDIAEILGKQTFETQKIVSKARLNAGRNQGDK